MRTVECFVANALTGDKIRRCNELCSFCYMRANAPTSWSESIGANEQNGILRLKTSWAKTAAKRLVVWLFCCRAVYPNSTGDWMCSSIRSHYRHRNEFGNCITHIPSFTFQRARARIEIFDRNRPVPTNGQIDRMTIVQLSQMNCLAAIWCDGGSLNRKLNGRIVKRLRKVVWFYALPLWSDWMSFSNVIWPAIVNGIWFLGLMIGFRDQSFLIWEKSRRNREDSISRLQMSWTQEMTREISSRCRGTFDSNVNGSP